MGSPGTGGAASAVAAATALALAAACGGPSGGGAPGAEVARADAVVRGDGDGAARLRLTPAQRERLAARPNLARRVARSAYDHFRFQHEAFTEAVCDRFGDARHRLPIVNLHGDAHLEQFAITHHAHGLDDFDEAGFGPAVVDLVRFAASLHLACAAGPLACDPSPAVAAFLDGYEAALLDPDVEAPPPSIVGRLRAHRTTDPGAFLAWADSLRRPVSTATRAGIERSWAELVRMLGATHPEREPSFYALRAAGRIELGVGSALDEKFLLRIEGPSTAADDDVVVEVKQHPAVERTGCVYHPPTGGVLYPQVMQLRMGRLVPEVLAYVPHGPIDRPEAAGEPWTCWVRSWDAGYRELEVAEVADGAELVEIAADAGRQLGAGHCRHVTAPLESQHRFAQHEAATALRARVELEAAALAQATVEAWRLDRAALAAP